MTSRPHARCLDVATMGRALLGAGDAMDEEQQSHAARCPHCAEQIAAYRALLELGKSLPTCAPEEARREQVRTMVLALAGDRQEPFKSRISRRWWVAARAAVAVVAVSLAAMSLAHHFGRPEIPTTTTIDHRATVRAAPGSRFERASAIPDEIVRLFEGTILVEVEPRAFGERFRVVLGDGEIEVRGTAFEVTARNDRLVALRVMHGRVELRRRADPVIVLAAGQEWRHPGAPSEPTSTATPAATSSSAAVAASAGSSSARQRLVEVEHVVGVRSAAAPGGVSPSPSAAGRPESGVGTDAQAEAAFREGWRALDAGEAARAVRSFARVLSAAPRSPLVEDATYWRAVALHRQGHGTEAATALAEFVRHFRESPRRGEAALVLGEWLLERGDRAGAETWLREAALDSTPAIRDHARRGLARISSSGNTREVDHQPPALELHGRHQGQDAQ